jgi:hypothetical protein
MNLYRNRVLDFAQTLHVILQRPNIYNKENKQDYKFQNNRKFNVHVSVHCENTLIYIQQDAKLHSLFYLETALHVSGGTTTHHQERKQLYLQHLVFVTPLLLPSAVATTHIRFWLAQPLSSKYLYSVLLSSKCVHSRSLSIPKRHLPNVF